MSTEHRASSSPEGAVSQESAVPPEGAVSPENPVPPESPVWTGRTDGPGAAHHRWHHIVGSGSQPPVASAGRPDAPSFGLVGFSSDEGVRRNQGRVGARQGPAALRRALGSLAIHDEFSVTDEGDVTVMAEDLEDAQRRLGERTARMLDANTAVIVLGGGHETAFGSYQGLTNSTRLQDGRRLGILNLDAHFDLREADRPSSGTPFRQMAEAERAAGRPFDYVVLGISTPSNTAALFATADRLNVHYILDEECTEGTRVDDVVTAFLDRVDVVHLSVDLDVLPAAVAPGVSAPAGYGVPLDVIHAVCRRIAASGKLALMDVVELNPDLDVDDRTARTAARLITTVVHTAAALAPKAPQVSQAPTAS